MCAIGMCVHTIFRCNSCTDCYNYFQRKSGNWRRKGTWKWIVKWKCCRTGWARRRIDLGASLQATLPVVCLVFFSTWKDFTNYCLRIGKCRRQRKQLNHEIHSGTENFVVSLLSKLKRLMDFEKSIRRTCNKPEQKVRLWIDCINRAGFQHVCVNHRFFECC